MLKLGALPPSTPGPDPPSPQAVSGDSVTCAVGLVAYSALPALVHGDGLCAPLSLRRIEAVVDPEELQGYVAKEMAKVRCV